MGNKVKLFFEQMDKKQRKEFLQFDLQGIKNVQKGYKKGSVAYNACQEKIDKKQAEIAALE